jgi:tetratricopeptide (TPR) repeat protein
MMVVMGLACGEEPNRLELVGRPLRSVQTACIVALAAFALMEQVGTAILEPPTAWAMLIILVASLPVARARHPAGATSAAAAPGLCFGLVAKSALMAAAMVAGFAYVKWLVIPVGDESAWLAAAEARGAPLDRIEPLEAAGEANTLAWEPALERGRIWQAEAAAEHGPPRLNAIERAIQAYDEAVTRQPRLLLAYLAMAECRLLVPGGMDEDREAWAAALRYVEQAHRLYPTDLPTQVRLASLVDRLGDRPGRALAEYRRALDLSNEMPEADRRLNPDARRTIEGRIRDLEEPLAKPASK